MNGNVAELVAFAADPEVTDTAPEETAVAVYSFAFSFDSFSSMKERMSSDMSRSRIHCSL